MVSAPGKSRACWGTQEFLDAAKLAWGAAYRLYLPFWGGMKGNFHFVTRIMPRRSLYQGVRVHLRDCLLGLSDWYNLRKWRDSWSGCGSGLVSAVARKDTSKVAAEILLNPKEWKIKAWWLGPEDLPHGRNRSLLSKETVKGHHVSRWISKEAYESRKNGQHKLGVMHGSVPIRRSKLANRLGFQQISKKF